MRETLTQVDVVGFCLPANEKVGPGDAFIAAELTELRGRRRRTAVVAIATKADLVDRERLAAHLLAIQGLGEWDDIVPCSALAPPGQAYPGRRAGRRPVRRATCPWGRRSTRTAS